MPPSPHPNIGASECLAALEVFSDAPPWDRVKSDALKKHFGSNANAANKWRQIFGYMDADTLIALADLAKQAKTETWRDFPGLMTMYGFLQDAFEEYKIANAKVQCSGPDNPQVGRLVYGGILKITKITEEQQRAFLESQA